MTSNSEVEPDLFEWIGRGGAFGVEKAELSGSLIQNTKEAPPWDLCITSG